MAWLKPAKKGVDDWEERLQRNDPTLTAIHVFKARKFGHEVRLYLRPPLPPTAAAATWNNSVVSRLRSILPERSESLYVEGALQPRTEDMASPGCPYCCLSGKLGAGSWVHSLLMSAGGGAHMHGPAGQPHLDRAFQQWPCHGT